jgi:hypothetical protein
MPQIGKKILLGFTVILLLMFSGLLSQLTFAANSNIFTAQDAPIPGLNLALVEDVPMMSYASAYGGGWQLIASLKSDVMDGTLHLRIFVDYTISCINSEEGATSLFNDQTPNFGLSTSEVQSVLNDPSNTVIKSNIQGKSKTLIYQVLPQESSHPQCAARVIVQSQTYPNWIYWIFVYGNGFSGAADLETKVNLVIDHCQWLILTKQQNNPTSTPTTTPTSATPTNVVTPTESSAFTPQTSISLAPTPTRSGQDNEKFTVNYHSGNVQVKFKGETNWVTLKDDMVLYPGDEIITTSSGLKGGQFSFVELHHSGMDYYSDRDILLSFESGMKLEHSPIPAEEVMTDIILYEGGFGTESAAADFVFQDTALIGKNLLSDTRIVTPDSIITTKGTQFEVIINQTGTIVRTFSGIVEVTDLNGENSVNVGANQTCTVPSGGNPGTVATFNPSNVDQWWTKLPTPQPSSTAGFDLQGLLPYTIPIVAIAAVVVVVAVVFGRRHRRLLPSPPPPP